MARGRRRHQRFNKQAFASPRAHAEAFRILRTNLDVALAEQERPIIAVTSANPGEGKTATTVNLARSLALTGRRVLLIDLDLRHPDAHNHLQVPNEPGASEVLRGLVPLGTALQYVPVRSENLVKESGLWFLPTGGAVPDPAEMLDGTRTDALLDRLAEQADVVLVDTPPLLPVADTLVIARRVTGAVLVIEARRTPIGAIEHARTSLERNETPLLGVIVNKLQARDARQGSGYGYGYGYGYGTEGGSPANATPAPTSAEAATRSDEPSGRPEGAARDGHEPTPPPQAPTAGDATADGTTAEGTTADGATAGGPTKAASTTSTSPDKPQNAASTAKKAAGNTAKATDAPVPGSGSGRT